MVYVFIAGRGLVDPGTGAVSVIPFDGTATSSARLYSLRRLQESLSKLPVQRAIVIVDLSLDETCSEPFPKDRAIHRNMREQPLTRNFIKATSDVALQNPLRRG